MVAFHAQAQMILQSGFAHGRFQERCSSFEAVRPKITDRSMLGLVGPDEGL